jgi:RNA-directed DNA polymerase
LAKTWKDLSYERMITNERIERATHNAGKGKRQSVSYLKYANNPKKRERVHDDLKNGTYRPLLTEDRVIFDTRSGKHRTIRRPAFRDQIVHHLLMLELQPYCMKEIIKHNIACIPHRGMEYGRKIVKSWTKKKSECRYLIQGDVHHYYQSADGAILMKFFRKKIRDKRILNLLQMIVDTFTQGFVLGYYVCQWFGALYLTALDHAVKEKFRIKCYVRYVDNILIGCRTKKLAKQVLDFIHRHLFSVKLRLKQHGKECVRLYRWSGNFVDFIGIRTYRDGKQTIRRKTYLSIRRLMERIIASGSCSLHQARSLLSRKGIVQHTDCSRFLGQLEALVASMHMKRIVKYAQQKN